MHNTQASVLRAHSAQRVCRLCHWWKWFIFIYSILGTFFIFASIPISVFNFNWFCAMCDADLHCWKSIRVHFLYFDWMQMNGENRFNQCHSVFCMWIEFYFRKIFFYIKVLNTIKIKRKNKIKGGKTESINFACENKMEIETTARYFVATNVTQSFVRL